MQARLLIEAHPLIQPLDEHTYYTTAQNQHLGTTAWHPLVAWEAWFTLTNSVYQPTYLPKAGGVTPQRQLPRLSVYVRPHVVVRHPM